MAEYRLNFLPHGHGMGNAELLPFNVKSYKPMTPTRSILSFFPPQQPIIFTIDEQKRLQLLLWNILWKRIREEKIKDPSEMPGEQAVTHMGSFASIPNWYSRERKVDINGPVPIEETRRMAAAILSIRKYMRMYLSSSNEIGNRSKTLVQQRASQRKPCISICLILKYLLQSATILLQESSTCTVYFLPSHLFRLVLQQTDVSGNISDISDTLVAGRLKRLQRDY